MGILQLTPPEKQLIRDVEHGDETIFTSATEEISAEVLRHIMLGLPLFRRRISFPASRAACAVTGAGIRVRGAVIGGRVMLDTAIGSQGGPLFPLEFQDCVFDAGFSGARAHFSRLSFRNCIFAVPGNPADPITKQPLPTVDLSAAVLDGPLEMEGVQPAPGGKNQLWIRAPGIRVAGRISLSNCKLRAPRRIIPGKPLDEGEAGHTQDALDLTLGQVEGDLSFDGGSKANGRLKLRAIDVRGDVWLDNAKLDNPGEREEALFLQGARIKGFLSIQYPDGAVKNVTTCTGRIDLTAAEIGRSLILKSKIEGDIRAPDLIVRDDFFLHGVIDRGRVTLDRGRIGGSLDMSRLKFEGRPPESPSEQPDAGNGPVRTRAAISLASGTIGAALRLSPKPASSKEEEEEPFPAGFAVNGLVDLTGLACDMLDDNIGRRWGETTVIQMNHFTYRRTGWLSDGRSELGGRRRGKPSYRIVSDWIQSRRADGLFPWRFFPRWLLSRDEHFWEPWHLRRNWIYQHYGARQVLATATNPLVSIARHRIREEDYRPQPFEQAIRVARAEGREDFATQFEMHKQRLEWRFFNQRVRWALGIAAIILSTLWLGMRSVTAEAMTTTAAAAAITLALMIFGSSIRRQVRRRVVAPLLSPGSFFESAHAAFVIVLLPLWFCLSGWVASTVGIMLVAYSAIWAAIFGSSIAAGAAGPSVCGKQVLRAAKTSSKFLTWIAYWIPAILLFFAAGWVDKPFHIIVSTMIFAAIRLLSVIAHAVMRFGFGYMRRPVNAIVTLILAFLIGWWGVGLAKSRHMFVVAAQPTAELAGRFNIPRAESAKQAHGSETETIHAMGSLRGEGRAVRNLSCSHEMSVPLYALDVLIPIVDLGERERCEIRRFATSAEPQPAKMPPAELYASFPEFLLRSHRFWWWIEAIYAILGWVLVSLAILTFAQVNKMHAEPPHEHK